jgi:CRP/FNR family cyclic AMP-dependent transcriptional regulator
MKGLKALIQDHPFFAGLDDDYLELAAGCASNRHFKAGEYLFHEGDAADRFYLLRSGRVRLEIAAPGRGPVIVETIQSGEVIGWSWLFPPYLWQFDAQATQTVRATAFDGNCLREKCAANHDLGYELAMRSAQILIQRLQATRLQLLDVYGTRP